MTETETPKLPMLYNELTPLTHTRHGDYGVAETRDFSFARELTFAPLTMDEFPQAQRDYPIVFTTQKPTVPVALFGGKAGTNQFVEEDGSWRVGAYVPGYLRRYPFQMVREKEGSDRHVLCADLTSSFVVPECDAEDRRLFDGEKPGAAGKKAMEFCQAYEAAMTRTRRTVEELETLNLISSSAINLKNGAKESRIDGVGVIEEAKLRDLPEATTASLAKRGVLPCLYAHLFSMANFARIAAK